MNILLPFLAEFLPAIESRVSFQLSSRVLSSSMLKYSKFTYILCTSLSFVAFIDKSSLGSFQNSKSLFTEQYVWFIHASILTNSQQQQKLNIENYTLWHNLPLRRKLHTTFSFVLWYEDSNEKCCLSLNQFR